MKYLSMVSLQWGRNFIVTESCMVLLGGAEIKMLQWGRNFIVTESGFRIRNNSLSTCFNGAVTSSLRKDQTYANYNAAATSFNGAVTSSLRKAGVGATVSARRVQLQWGRNFIVTERMLSPLITASKMLRFNGAVTSSLRKVALTSCGQDMTPGFNGAVTSSLRKAQSRWTPCTRSRCFNGAVTSSLRKADYLFDAVRDGAQLQWGRNFIVTESTYLNIVTKIPPIASMGP